MLNYLLRGLADEDKPFIYNSFLKNYKQYSDCKYIPNTLYFTNQKLIIDYLLSNSTTIISCFPEEPSELFGYIIYEHFADSLVIHYMYIRNSFRNKCFAKNLIKDILLPNTNLIIATHITSDFINLRHKMKPIRMIYNPFYITNKRLLQI